MARTELDIAVRLEAVMEELRLILEHVRLPETRSSELSRTLGPRKFLSVKELAKELPMAEQTIRNKMSSGELVNGVHFYKKGRRIFCDWNAIEDWLKQPKLDERAVEPFYPVHNGRSRKAQ